MSARCAGSLDLRQEQALTSTPPACRRRPPSGRQRPGRRSALPQAVASRSGHGVGNRPQCQDGQHGRGGSAGNRDDHVGLEQLGAVAACGYRQPRRRGVLIPNEIPGAYEVKRAGHEDEQCLYIGKAGNLRSRIRQCLVKGNGPHPGGKLIREGEDVSSFLVPTAGFTLSDAHSVDLAPGAAWTPATRCWRPCMALLNGRSVALGVCRHSLDR